MPAILDFTDAELRLVNQTLLERYGHVVIVDVAEAEISLAPESGEMETCPVLFWNERGAHFVVFKIGNNSFRAQFYYSEAQQFGTGKPIFDNLGDCIVTVLQVQSDHERQMAGIRSGMTSKDFQNPDDYDGPLMI